ncbi:unnamed protein product [Sphacelaria rigidula]
MKKEVEGLEGNNTWTVLDSPFGEKAVDSKWVFQWKTDEHGCVMKANARLGFRGDRQEIGDILTFSPTPPTATNRVAAAVACAEGRTIFHFDVEQAFVQSELEEDVCMRLPPGLGERSGTVVHLHKTLYGLKQAAREWYGKLGKTLDGLGFEQSLIDPCVFRLMDGEEVRILIVVHVDDMFVVGAESVCNKMTEDLNTHFPTKNLGELVWYAGCEYKHDLEKGALKLSQTAYTQRILERLSIKRTAETPAFVFSDFKVGQGENFEGRYRETVGSLVWLSINTRPDIADAVRAASRHNENPTPED